jgi:hypothetical protein
MTRIAVVTRRLLAPALLLMGIAAVGAGCIFVPVGGYGPPGPVVVAPVPPPVVVVRPPYYRRWGWW